MAIAEDCTDLAPCATAAYDTEPNGRAVEGATTKGCSIRTSVLSASQSCVKLGRFRTCTSVAAAP